jgi:hypothetical protein
MFKKFIAKLKVFFIKNNKFKNKINKEKSMGEYQGNENKLDYTKVQQAFNKAKGKTKQENLMTSLRDNLNNFSKKFQDLSKDEKQQELNSQKFKQLSKDVNSLNHPELQMILDKMENQKELSEFERLSKQIEDIQKTLIRLENEDIKEQGKNLSDIVISTDKIDEIAKIIDNSFWNNLKNKITKVDLTPITKEIDSIKNDINKELAKEIDNIKFPTPPKIPKDYLKKDDFEFTINNKLKDLQEIKESSENLETVPAKVNSIENELKNLSEKLDNLPSSNGSQTPKHIPTEEKSVIALAQYMTDGVAQFENIAKEYISKIGELKKLDKIKETHQIELEKVKENEFKSGKEAGKIELIKNLAENFPTEFKAIQSTFEDLLEEKFEKDKTLEIDDKNINEMLLFIENKIENGNYKVISPALLVDKEILFKASVEKAD